MAKYQQIVPTIDAVQWTGDLPAVQELFPDAVVNPDDDQILFVPSPMGGTYMVPMGYWVTKDQNGNMNYLPDESFTTMWEAVAG
jgi:hypothetical protein